MAKRSAHGSGSIRKRPNGTWEARYTLGNDPGTGKPIRKSVYGKTQKEVREKLRAATAAIDEGTYFEPAKFTLGQWLDEWLITYTADLKPLTLAAYQAHIEKNIKPYIGAVRLAALDAPTIQRLYNRLHCPPEPQKPLSAKTIKNLHGVLHKALKQAVEVGYIKFNPSDACKLPKVKRTEIQPLEGDTVSALFTALEGDRYRLLYLIDLFTGMRQGELLGLTWDCVDFERNEICIQKQLQKQKTKGGHFYFAPLKNGKSRSVTVAPSVMGYFRAQRATQAEQRVRAGQRWDGTGGVFKDANCQALSPKNIGLVFTNEWGGHLVGVTVYKHFKQLAADIGIPSARFHDLRHSFAVASLESGDDIKTVQENLGHATASFTLDVYGHVSAQMKKDSADRMEQYIQKRASKG